MESLVTFVILAALGFAGRACGEDGGIPNSVRRNLQALSLASESWVGEVTGEPGEEFGECSVKATFPPATQTEETDGCNSEMSCIPILTLPSSHVRTLGLERAGVCVNFPGGHGKEDAPSTAYVFDSSAEMPVPLGYFPLTFDSVNSWPFPTFKGTLDGQKFVEDEVFGSVLKCDKSTVRLPSINYAAKGAFSVNFWMKRDEPGEGIGFEYVFSHMKDGASAGIRGDSQIQVYLPRDPLPAHGILRAAVKDSNDKDEGRASDTYLDSDGEVGNNSDRDFGDDHVDFYDGKWHMVTLTSIEDKPKGFKMYVDGAMVGKVRPNIVKATKNGKRQVDLQVTGGDPIDLTGKIHLCGRAVDSEDRYFEGSIAHLALFDTPLSREQVQDLFQTFFATKNQVDGESGEDEVKLTKEGNTCLFPTLHRGKWITECVPLSNTQECPVAAGVWQECDFFASEHDDDFQITDIGKEDDSFEFVTVDGEACVFPAFYSGRIHRECISIHGEPKCPTQDGIWKDCKRVEKGEAKAEKSASDSEAKEGPSGTIYGDACVFPFKYRGESFNECTHIGGVWSCQIESGEFAPCAIVRNPETDYMVNPDAPVISRVTLGGKKCFFPYWYGEESIADCYPDNGVPSCPTEDDGIQPCAPLRLTMEGEPCAMPFFHNFSTYTDCVEVEGQEHCMTRNGEFKTCAPHGSEIYSTATGAPHLRILTARPSVNGGNCQFPFWYKGKLASECVQEGDSEFCRTLHGAWEECAPQRLTTDGRNCSIPFNTEDGESHYDCIQVEKTFQCPTAAEEPWGECLGDFDFVPVAEPGAEMELEEDMEEEIIIEEETEVEGDPAADGADSELVEVEHSGALPEDRSFRTSEEFPSESWIGELTAGNGELYGACQMETAFPGAAGKEELPGCTGDLSCVPVLATPGATPELEGLERTGMCVSFPGSNEKVAGPPGAAYIFDPLKAMPIPMGYFPLVSGTMSSWPFPSYKGQLKKQKFVEDEVFGSVIQCKKGAVVLPAISYAASGAFAINMWIKREKAGKGVGFEYIFSHMKKGASAGFRKDSQIQLYLPRDPLPAHGVLRAVVKDSNDLDVGEASESFLDSDGQVGNNSDRDFGDDHVDFYDGKWHMVTLTSIEDKPKGFKMYVDGAMVGKVRPNTVKATKNGKRQVDLQVTGGDPIDLTGEIHLCGRAVDSEDRYFEGSIAHLALFDTPLSREQVQDLFQTFFATKKQVDATIPTEDITLTKGGGACMFPSLYRGGWTNKCVDMEGVKKCPSAPATWTECDSTNAEKDEKLLEDKTHGGAEGENNSGSDFKTVDGEDCELPVYYEGKLHEGCVTIDGAPKCHAKGGEWKECRTKNGEKVSVEKEEKSGEPQKTEASEEDGVSKEKETNTSDSDGPFVTVDGEDCELPVYYEGKLHEGCVTIGGAPKCHAKGGEWKECKPKKGTENSERKEGKAQEKKSSEEESSKAVVRDPQSDYNINSDAPLIGRVTTDGQKCYFPFWYGQESIGGCFLKDGVPSCPSGRDGVKPCAPLRLTVQGQPCSMPFTHQGKEHFDCTDVDGKEHCMTPDGELNQCAPLVEEANLEEDYKIVAARATVRNNNCAFPFWHQGKLVSDCVKQGEGEFCRTMLGKWEECAPQQWTVDGQKCSIPFEYEGEYRFECVEIEGVVQCPTSREEPWGECARKESTEKSFTQDGNPHNVSG
ncbi:hypothetical protein BSKO_06575 [Bryopsis sp. KO-2023]|nr:hypothetical protein BSKO_06575 [Bryopsis sp. KO-2023]